MNIRAKPAPATVTVHVPITFVVRGGRKTIIGDIPQIVLRARFDNALIKAIARAFRWQELLENGSYGTIEELAGAEKLNPSYVSRILRLTLLAPDIVEAVLDGRQHSELTIARLSKPFPIIWAAQKTALQ